MKIFGNARDEINLGDEDVVRRDFGKVALINEHLKYWKGTRKKNGRNAFKFGCRWKRP